MRALLALVVGLIASTVSAEQPLTFWRYAGDPIQLQSAMDCALTRWHAATCLPVDVSYYAAHWVRQDVPAGMGYFSGYTWGTSWSQQRIKLSSALTTDDARCQVLVHEIGHLLRRDYGHSTEDGSMSFGVTHVVASPRSRITVADLTDVCSKQPCTCFNPEP